MKIQLFLVFLLFAQITFAQDTFVDGYVVTLSQDTLRGKIKYGNWEISPTKIEFLDAKNTKNLYLPDDLKAFQIDLKKEIYVTKTLKLDYFLQSEIAEHQRALLESKTETVFLRLLLRGDKASLYQFNDRDNRVRFFTEKDNQTVELVNFVYKKKVETESATKLIEFKKEIYKSQIPLICQDAPKSILKEMPLYDQSSMMDFFSKYNACFLGDKVEFATEKDKVKFALIPIVGTAFYPNIMAKGYEVDLLGRSWKPLYGVSLQMLEPRKNYNRFVQLDVQLIPSVKYYKLTNNIVPSVLKRTNINFSLIGGSYFGKDKNILRPYAFAGVVITPVTILFEMGAGLSFKKKLHINYVTSFFILNQISVGYRIDLSKK